MPDVVGIASPVAAAGVGDAAAAGVSGACSSFAAAGASTGAGGGATDASVAIALFCAAVAGAGGAAPSIGSAVALVIAGDSFIGSTYSLVDLPACGSLAGRSPSIYLTAGKEHLCLPRIDVESPYGPISLNIDGLERFLPSIQGEDIMARILCFIVVLVAGSGAAWAQDGQSIGHNPAEERACRGDAHRFCKDELADEFRTASCLQEHRDHLSRACRAVIEGRGM